jgi:hypothetical protein
MSLIVLNDSPSVFLIFLPDLSFFFFVDRTFENDRATLEGKLRGGRWNERASLFVSRVLYYCHPQLQ